MPSFLPDVDLGVNNKNVCVFIRHVTVQNTTNFLQKMMCRVQQFVERLNPPKQTIFMWRVKNNFAVTPGWICAHTWVLNGTYHTKRSDFMNMHMII